MNETVIMSKNKAMLDARMALAEAMRDLVAIQMGWDRKKSHGWMSEPNPNLGNTSPLKMILSGRTHKLMEFIETAIDESKP